MITAKESYDLAFPRSTNILMEAYKIEDTIRNMALQGGFSVLIQISEEMVSYLEKHGFTVEFEKEASLISWRKF